MRAEVASGSHYVYAVEFSDAVVKVGRTSDLSNRMSQHKAEGRKRNAYPVRIWSVIGQRYWLAQADEQALIEFCRQRWSKAKGHEYFAAADFAQITAYLAALNDRATARLRTAA